MQECNANTKVQVKRIAIINPYLQGGHVHIAETESVVRFKQAANNMGIILEMFANSEELYDFDPDFAIAITYQEGKLTSYPTFVSLNIAISLIENVPRFVRNILSCDGFITISNNVKNWLQQLCHKHDKSYHLAHAAFSVPQTEFYECDFSKAVAMYMGTNWDGERHNNLFKLLNNGKYLKCYGPRKSWEKYPALLYGGEIPFDGMSAFKAYRQHALGLCIGHPVFDKEGIASSRLFEIAAAGALPICSDNVLTQSIYGDSVLYLDRYLEPKELSEQIVTAVQWARSNPKMAAEMAKEAHHIFNERASMEVYLKNIIHMHQSVMQKNGYNPPEKLLAKTIHIPPIKTKPKVAYVIMQHLVNENNERILLSICQQTYADIEIIISAGNEYLYSPWIAEHNSQNIPVKYFDVKNCNDLQKLYQYLQESSFSWLALVDSKMVLYKNHTAVLLSRAQTYSQLFPNDRVAIIGTGCIEFSSYQHIADTMTDEHKIYDENKMRIAHVHFSPKNSLGSCFINTALINEETFLNINYHYINAERFLMSMQKSGKCLATNELTCALNVDDLSLLKRQANRLNTSTLKNDYIDLDRKLLITRLNELEYNLKVKDELLQAIYKSKSWQITAPLRKVMGLGKALKIRLSHLLINKTSITT